MDFDNNSRFSGNVNRQTLIDKLTMFISASQGQLPLNYKHYGHFIQNYDGSGFLGGILENVTIDQHGFIEAAQLSISSLLGCGHIVNHKSQVAGICYVCGRICCNNPSCLLVCDFTGLTVCRRHYKIKHGVVVSSPSQKGLWKFKAKKLGKKKRAFINDRKQLTERT